MCLTTVVNIVIFINGMPEVFAGKRGSVCLCFQTQCVWNLNVVYTCQTLPLVNLPCFSCDWMYVG